MDIVEKTFLWAVLLLFPAMALYWRRWIVCGLYVLGCLIFLFTTLRDQDGWEDLAAVATLLVLVLPLYVLASVVWLIAAIRQRKGRSR